MNNIVPVFDLQCSVKRLKLSYLSPQQLILYPNLLNSDVYHISGFNN